jgi:hypothetical protein
VREVFSFAALSFTDGTRCRWRKERIANVCESMGSRITRWMPVLQSPVELGADVPDMGIFTAKGLHLSNDGSNDSIPRGFRDL